MKDWRDDGTSLDDADDARRLTTRATRSCDRANSGFFGEPANPELIGELGGELEDDISTLRLEERVEEVHIVSTRDEEAMAGRGGLLTPGDLLNPNALSGGRGMTQADFERRALGQAIAPPPQVPKPYGQMPPGMMPPPGMPPGMPPMPGAPPPQRQPQKYRGEDLPEWADGPSPVPMDVPGMPGVRAPPHSDAAPPGPWAAAASD